jgi:hypothetical protein
MRKLALALASLAALGIAAPLTTAAQAETVKIIKRGYHHDHGPRVVIRERHRHRHDGDRVVIKHRSHGNMGFHDRERVTIKKRVDY